MILALVTSAETAPPLATALTTVVDCADDGRHAKMEEWKGARAGRRWDKGCFKRKSGNQID